MKEREPPIEELRDTTSAQAEPITDANPKDDPFIARLETLLASSDAFIHRWARERIAIEQNEAEQDGDENSPPDIFKGWKLFRGNIS